MQTSVNNAKRLQNASLSNLSQLNLRYKIINIQLCTRPRQKMLIVINSPLKLSVYYRPAEKCYDNIFPRLSFSAGMICADLMCREIRGELSTSSSQILFSPLLLQYNTSPPLQSPYSLP